VARLGRAASLEPGARLSCLALLSSTALLAGPLIAGIVAIAAILLLLESGLKPLSLLRDVSFILVFALFTAALRFLGLPEAALRPLSTLSQSAVYGLRLLAAFLAGRLFYATTSASELRDATTRICRRIPLLGRVDIGLGLGMILGFIPLVFEEWKASLEAARSRGFARSPGLSKQALFVTAFLRRLMLRAVAVPEALSARGWTRTRGLPPLRWRSRDTVSTAVCGVLLLAAALHLV